VPLVSTFASSSVRAIASGIVLLPPNIPTSFSATGVSADNDTGGAVVTFTAPSTDGGTRPITSYQVQNVNTGVITTATSGSTVPLAKNATHTFRVRAVNNVGVSDWSNTDTALSFRQTYGGENGFYSSSTVYVSLPTNVTINYSLSSGAGSTSTPDTRTYGTVYAVTEWFGFDNFFAGPYVSGPVAYTPRGLDGHYWYGYVGGYSVYYDGYFSYAGFTGYPHEEYYYGYAPNFTFGVYAFPSTGVTGGSAPRGPDYGNRSYLDNNSLGYASSTIAQTNLGYNLTPNTVSGTFSGISQIRFDFGHAYYYYYYGGLEAYYGPSGRGRIWYGT
jgi:hypothetical protein